MVHQNGVKIKAYHIDNGIFRYHEQVNSCTKQSQAINFSGVNAHYKNSISEHRIIHLQYLTRTKLINAAKRCKSYIISNLWPYALCMENERTNNTPGFQDPKRRTPHKISNRTEVTKNQKHCIPFGCPAFALETGY